MVSGNNILEIPTLQLDNLVNKVIKILSGEKPSLIDIGLTKNLQPGKLLQGEIIKVLPKKKFAISFGGQKMIAEISEVSQKKEGNSSVAKARYLFKPGSKIYAKVEKLNPSPVLKLIPPTAQQIQEAGYTTNFSRKIKPEVIRFEKNSESNLLPRENVSVNTSLKAENHSLPVLTKIEAPFKIGNNSNLNKKNINPPPVISLTPPSDNETQEDRSIRKIPRRLTPGKLNFASFKNLKLPANNIIPVKIIRANNLNLLSVQFEDQKFFVRSENANLYHPGENVRIKFEKIANGLRPILLDPPRKFIQNGKDIKTSAIDYPAKQERITSTIQLQPQQIDNSKSYVLQDSPGNSKIIDLDLIKPYLLTRKPLGELIGELRREVLESAVLKNIPIKQELIERIRETLKILTPKPDSLPKEFNIKRQVDISGIGYEGKVKQLLLYPENSKNKLELGKDLKGQLLELNQILENSIRKNSNQNLIRQLTEFQQKIKVSVDNIELNQLSTRISNQESQPLVLQIPNPICPNEKTINLFIRKDLPENKSGENSDKESYSLAFYLELSSLGNIKINVKVGLNSMEVRMDVDREDIAEFVRNSASEFEERMKINGLTTSVECLKEEQVLPIKDNLIELLVSKNTSLLNVKT